MKDLDKQACKMVLHNMRNPRNRNETISFWRLGFYDPDVPFEDCFGKMAVIAASRFLEYTDGSPEGNAKIRERFPVLIDLLEGKPITIPVVNIELPNNGWHIKEKDIYSNKIYISHDAWVMKNDSPLYELEIVPGSELFDALHQEFSSLTIKLKNPEIPKQGSRLFPKPVRFDKFSTFNDLRWLLLSMTYWPNDICLFTAVTKYYREMPIYSTIVYKPAVHTMKDVFVRLFSKVRKGFCNSLFDIIKVLDIIEKHDSRVADEEKFSGYGHIGGLDKVTLKAWLALRTFCTIKDIKNFKVMVDGEINTTKKFVAKLERLKSECDKIDAVNPEATLKDLSQKLIEDLYDNVVVDPISYSNMDIDKTRWDSRDYLITKVLSDLCLTTGEEEALINNEEQGDNNNGENS